MKEPIVSADRAVTFVNSGAAGIFVPAAEHWSDIRKDDAVGNVIDPVTGNVEEYVISLSDGIVFFRYNRPLEFEKTVLYKIIPT